MKSIKSKKIVLVSAICGVLIIMGSIIFQMNESRYESDRNAILQNDFKPVELAYKTLSNGKVSFKAKFSDSQSGVKTIQYYLSTSASTPDPSSSSWSETNEFDLTCNRTYYVFARAIDNAGNISDVTTHLDTYYETCYVPNVPYYPEYPIPYYPDISQTGTTPNYEDTTPKSGIVETSTGTTVSGGTNDCDASCYLSNNGANWWDVRNSNLSDSDKAALEKALNQNSKDYVSSTGADAGYANSGVWTNSSGETLNDKGASSAATIGTNDQGEAYIQTSNGDTITVQNDMEYGQNVILTEHADGTKCWNVPGLGNVGNGC